MIIEEKYLELIHGELDGELPDRERAELSGYLLANPEARAFRDGLRGVCAALDHIEQVEPPPGLRESILEAIAIQAPAQGRTVPRQAGQAPQLLRYAAAFAGGLLVSAIAFQVGFESRDRAGVAELVGTMAGSNATSAPRRLDSMRLDHGQLAGEVSLYATGTNLVLAFDVAPQQTTEVVVVTDGREERFSWSAVGTPLPLRHALALGDVGQAGRFVTVRFTAGGQTIHEGVLEVSAVR